MTIRHPSSAIFDNLADAISYANEFVANGAAADFVGIPATGYVIFSVASEVGYSGTTYEVAFTRELAA